MQHSLGSTSLEELGPYRSETFAGSLNVCWPSPTFRRTGLCALPSCEMWCGRLGAFTRNQTLWPESELTRLRSPWPQPPTQIQKYVSKQKFRNYDNVSDWHIVKLCISNTSMLLSRAKMDAILHCWACPHYAEGLCLPQHAKKLHCSVSIWVPGKDAGEMSKSGKEGRHGWGDELRKQSFIDSQCLFWQISRFRTGALPLTPSSIGIKPGVRGNRSMKRSFATYQLRKKASWVISWLEFLQKVRASVWASAFRWTSWRPCQRSHLWLCLWHGVHDSEGSIIMRNTPQNFRIDKRQSASDFFTVVHNLCCGLKLGELLRSSRCR
jgi:hypothetical protein